MTLSWLVGLGWFQSQQKQALVWRGEIPKAPQKGGTFAILGRHMARKGAQSVAQTQAQRKIDVDCIRIWII